MTIHIATFPVTIEERLAKLEAFVQEHREAQANPPALLLSPEAQANFIYLKNWLNEQATA